MLQIDINVAREVLNHKPLVHPNVAQFEEVGVHHSFTPPHLFPPHPWSSQSTSGICRIMLSDETNAVV